MDSKMLFAIFLSERFIYYYLLEVSHYIYLFLLKTTGKKENKMKRKRQLYLHYQSMCVTSKRKRLKSVLIFIVSINS